MSTEIVRQQSHRMPSSRQYLRHTKVPTLVFSNSKEVDKHVALIMESLIRENNSAGLPTVLGLATGSTPIGVYRELIRQHQEEDLDFSRVITFNLDEYWPMESDSIHSYNLWMQETFFKHINILPQNIHIPQGNIARGDVDAFCDEYERAIEKAGGIDIQILGIGRTGHIGFNEPGSSRSSLTRLVTLDPVTRVDASSSFFGEENVPHHAITMGVQSILSAKKIIMIAFGEHKAPIIRKSVEADVTEDVTASFLQMHKNAIFCLDQAAAEELTAVKTPWIVGNVDWTPELEKRAVIWLSRILHKPLLLLEERDFIEHHLFDLLSNERSAEVVRQEVFDGMMETICSKPAGTTKQSAIVFSPHPDDDVISMGGTLITLADQGNDVHIAYMTSGNIAVFDHDAQRHIEYVAEFQKLFQPEDEYDSELYQRLIHSMTEKKPGDVDTSEVLEIKSLIRKTEAIAGAAVAGVPIEKLEFLNMPFYQTGEVTKKDIAEEDVEIVANLLRKLKPDQIYVAGDLSDPHGTHRMCASAILQALDVVNAEGIEPEVWLYRGAWQEYEPYEIERAVPLSPEVMMRKKMAIFKHESQKDRALFPGHDEREFWVRAEQRTKETARIYNDLGLPEYFALEGFVRYKGQL